MNTAIVEAADHVALEVPQSPLLSLVGEVRAARPIVERLASHATDNVVVVVPSDEMRLIRDALARADEHFRRQVGEISPWGNTWDQAGPTGPGVR